MFCHKSFSFRVDCNKGRSSNRRKLPPPVGATPLPPEATSLQCKFTTIIHFLPFRVYFYESNIFFSYYSFTEVDIGNVFSCFDFTKVDIFTFFTAFSLIEVDRFYYICVSSVLSAFFRLSLTNFGSVESSLDSKLFFRGNSPL